MFVREIRGGASPFFNVAGGFGRIDAQITSGNDVVLALIARGAAIEVGGIAINFCFECDLTDTVGKEVVAFVV